MLSLAVTFLVVAIVVTILGLAAIAKHLRADRLDSARPRPDVSDHHVLDLTSRK
jgi:hypothetical protein